MDLQKQNMLDFLESRMQGAIDDMREGISNARSHSERYYSGKSSAFMEAKEYLLSLNHKHALLPFNIILADMNLKELMALQADINEEIITRYNESLQSAVED